MLYWRIVAYPTSWAPHAKNKEVDLTVWLAMTDEKEGTQVCDPVMGICTLASQQDCTAAPWDHTCDSEERFTCIVQHQSVQDTL